MPYFLVRKKGVTKPTGVLIHAYGGFRAAQTPTYLTGAALSLRPARPVLGRGRRRLRPRQHPRRRRIWARPGGARASREAAEQLRRSGSGRARPDHDRRRAEGRHRHFRPLERRRAGRRGDDPASRPLFGGRSPARRCIDMQRYSQLLAGARGSMNMAIRTSPRTGPSCRKYSPYQNVRKQASAIRPPSSICRPRTTACTPAMPARWRPSCGADGNTVYYHEYLEGGHSVGADRSEDACARPCCGPS